MDLRFSQLFEYKDEKAYTKGQEVLGKLIAGNKSFFDKINLKRTASRSINLMDLWIEFKFYHLIYNSDPHLFILYSKVIYLKKN